jgi:hypothetical protein
LAFVKVGQVRDVDVFHSAGKNTASEWGLPKGRDRDAKMGAANEYGFF